MRSGRESSDPDGDQTTTEPDSKLTSTRPRQSIRVYSIDSATTLSGVFRLPDVRQLLEQRRRKLLHHGGADEVSYRCDTQHRDGRHTRDTRPPTMLRRIE